MAGEDEGRARGAPSRLGEGDPFATPEAERRPDRRLRGRLVAPVTVFTAGAGAERAGLTVSSVLVSPGEPPELVAIIDPLSDLHRLAEESGRLLVHVLRVGEEKTASFFAGLYPVDPFAELGHSDTAYGPRLDGAGVVVAARFSSSQPAGFENLLRAEIDSIELPPGSESPLSWYRGRYRRLES